MTVRERALLFFLTCDIIKSKTSIEDLRRYSESDSIFITNQMKCLACKNDTMIDSKTTYFADLPNCYLIIENVPCKKGSQCGETVFPMSVMERIDKIIASVEKLASKVCVLEYQSAA